MESTALEIGIRNIRKHLLTPALEMEDPQTEIRQKVAKATVKGRILVL